MNKYFRGILVALIISFSFSVASAQQAAVLELFHGAECPHCHDEIEFLPVIEAMYPDLEVKMYEVWHNEENKQLAEKRLREMGASLEGVPTNIIGEEIIVGFQPEKMIESLKKAYGEPSISREQAEKIAQTNSGNPAKKWIFGAILLVIIGGAVYSFSGKNK